MAEEILWWLVLTFGVALTGLAMIDAVITTLAVVERPGPLTRVLSVTLWRGLRHLTARSGSALLRSAGPLVALSVVSTWLAGAWLGWSLIFTAFPGTIMELDTGQPASFPSVVYFTANTIVTTGAGDFVPSTDLWRVVSGVTSVSGLGLITLVITYLIPVTTAATFRFRFAQSVSAIGATPDEIVLHHWDGEGIGELGEAAPTLMEGIVRLRAEHLAYPVLHFFHTGDQERALALRVAALDEALTIATVGLAPEHRLPDRNLAPLRTVIADLLETVVTQSFAVPRDEVPSPPALDRLHQAGIPTVDRAEFERAVEHLAERRRKLCSFVRDDAWNWPEVARHPKQPSRP